MSGVEVGLPLSDSPFKAGADFEHAIEVAKSARGNDGEGYRAEFIRLAEQMQLLADNR